MREDQKNYATDTILHDRRSTKQWDDTDNTCTTGTGGRTMTAAALEWLVIGDLAIGTASSYDLAC
ncbi:hypothetical protein FOMPIDRAFT_162074 [Fomitopsis schrenkii]|uniref:Uncharacterized protein n=1 Tax=Fomitopsis schrenkii TaxID=2126942 RepID=S8EA15_FOMSC|nr:hypothetical protein FOMPIDRAFT_162074 [Fomitopsis schrenkii]